MPCFGAVKRDIGVAALFVISVAIMLFTPQYRVLSPKVDDMPSKGEQIEIFSYETPIQPVKITIVTIRVVVSLLCPAHFVTHQDHGNPLAEHQDGQCIFNLAVPQEVYGCVIRFTLPPAIPAEVVVASILIIFQIRLVVFLVVAYKILESKTVMAGYKIDAGIGLSSA